MLDSIYHMSLRLLGNFISGVKKLGCFHYLLKLCYGCYFITLPKSVNCVWFIYFNAWCFHSQTWHYVINIKFTLLKIIRKLLQNSRHVAVVIGVSYVNSLNWHLSMLFHKHSYQMI